MKVDLQNGNEVAVGTFFPDVSPGWYGHTISLTGVIDPLPDFNERVFASWYTGELYISQGKVIERSGIGHGGLFERLITLEVIQGIVVEEKIEEPGGFL